MSTAEEVNVEVINGLAAIVTNVDDGAVAVFEVQIAGKLGGDEQEVPEDGFILRFGVGEGGNFLQGDDQNMRGRLGIDIVESEAAIVLMDDRSGKFTVDDAFENSFRHGDVPWKVDGGVTTKIADGGWWLKLKAGRCG